MKRFHPSPALVISLIALFVALGGTSYAAIATLPANSVGTVQLKNRAVTSSKINATGLAIEPEAWHEIGAPGQPAFQSGWVNESTTFTTAAFYKDPFGRIYLKGYVKGGTGLDSTIFTLPPGYRPSKNVCESTWAAGAASYICVVASTGIVEAGRTSALLDGLSFRVNE
jgi:hypothetical protein